VWCSWEAGDTHVFGAEQAEIVLADPASDEAAAIVG
jgi:hypothetical protein